MSASPTPWVANLGTMFIRTPNGQPVAAVYGDDPECKPDECSVARTSLIAAAPELYEALEQCSAILAGYARKGIVSEQDAFQIRESGLSITTAAALDNADAALSKANAGTQG